MLFKYLTVLVASFILGAVFNLLLKKFSLRYKVLNPKGIPLVGGISMGLAFYIASLLGLGGLSGELIGLLSSSFIILFFGILDDRHELSVWLKFLVQIFAAAILIAFGVKTQIIYFSQPLNIIVTLIWILGITNAFNHLDVIDGLAGASGLIISLCFFFISVINRAGDTAVLSLAVAGAAFAFLVKNLPPAKIYMGNSGSHFLGFILAAIALIISYAPLERKIALLSPLLILGLPIFDTSFLIFVRTIKKNLPFNKSNDHLALRYLSLGHSKKKALFRMLSLCLFFCLCGIILTQVSNLLGLVIVGCAFLVSMVIAVRMSKVAVSG